MTAAPPVSLLEELARFLQQHPAVREKACIHEVYAPAESVAGISRLGDDCAAIPDPSTGGHLLFAAEGMLDSFVRDDPWFAGYSAVMVNLSDVAAMGGTPIAITDVLVTPDMASAEEIWAGMRAASETYGVPIVGGHTTLAKVDSPRLSAAVLGRAGEELLTSFDAKPGDALVIAIDMRGTYRGNKPFWNASTGSPPDRLRGDLALLPQVAERRLSLAAKDISNGGIIGTLAMLAHCSGVGAILDLAHLPKPDEAGWERWLVSFPSFGFLFAVPQPQVAELAALFASRDLACAPIGHFTENPDLVLTDDSARVVLDFGLEA
ncbi:sll0787 family AIR synthase-like protein [Luteolibacter soli]|uniref:Sll0787 family AIR synthase-like protein n=1 Tax=Luteolibacter soli TaxID=3135280 RepID=A0ABU9AT98_9BACT